MTIIKEFNKNLNDSLLHVKSRSGSFRSQLDIVLKSAILKSNDFKQALIIGAGKMDDFSLSFFLRYFGKVVLTDVDSDTMRSSIRNLQLQDTQRKKLVIREVEYTGFSDIHFFEDFRDQVVQFQTYDEIDHFLHDKFLELEHFMFMPDKSKQFDFIYVSPIYTQLVYNQILLECSLLRESGYPENLIKYLENKVLEEMIPIIDRFNHNLIQLLSSEGTLFVLSDIFEVDVDSNFGRRIASGIDSRDVVDQIYEEYVEKYGMGLGDYGLYSLDELLTSITHKWFIWEYKEDKSLVIKLKIYKNRSLHKEVIL